MRQTLKKSEILRGRKSFEAILSAGRRIDGKLLRCYHVTEAPPQCTAATVRVGFAISRRIRRAVDRNRVRRLMKEAYRTHKELLAARFPAHRDARTVAIVFLYLPAAGRPLLPSYQEMVEDMQSILTSLTATARP